MRSIRDFPNVCVCVCARHQTVSYIAVRHHAETYDSYDIPCMHFFDSSPVGILRMMASLLFTERLHHVAPAE